MSEEKGFADTHNIGNDAVQQDGIVKVMMRIFNLLLSLQERLNGKKKRSNTGVKLAEEHFGQDGELVQWTAALADEIRAMIFSSLRLNRQEAAVLLPEHLASILDEVRDQRSLVLNGLDIAPELEEDEEDDDTEQLLEDFSAAKLALEGYEKFLKAFYGKSLDELDPAMLTKDAKGKTRIKTVKTPSVNTEGKSSAGRKDRSAYFTWSLNGERLKVNGLLDLAILHCSTDTYRLNGDELVHLIRLQTGEEITKLDDFTVTVPTGELSAKRKVQA